MKFTLDNLIQLPLPLLLGVGLLLSPELVLASSHISHSSHSQVSSDIEVTSSGGNASVEISQTTISNGQQSTYYFATSTTDSFSHQVHTIDGEVQSPADGLKATSTTSDSPLFNFNPPTPPSSTTPYSLGGAITEQDLVWLRELINYLYAYVQQLI